MATAFATPTPEEIDRRLAAYEELAESAAYAESQRSAAEAALIPFIKQHGTRSDRATESVRIVGNHHEGLVTYGVTKTLVPERVIALRDYLKENSRVWLFRKMFEESTKFSLITGAHDALAGHDLPKKIREKALQLFGLCTDMRDKKPSLKVSVVKVKSAKKARGGKAAA